VPTLTARLDASVDDGELTARVSAQVDRLAVARGLLAGLDDDPPTALRDLVRAAGRVRLPALSDVSGLGGVLDGVATLIPADLDDLTSSLTTAVEALTADIGGDLVAAVGEATATIGAVRRLLDLDLSCAPASGSGGDGGAGSPEGDLDEDGAGEGEGGASGPRTAARAAEIASRTDLVLDTLPDPLEVEGVLRWIADRAGFRDRDRLLPPGIPLLDDLREPIQRLLAWDTMSAAAIRAELAATLQAVADLLTTNVRGAVTAIVDVAAPAPALLDAADLGAVTDGLVGRLGDVRTALETSETAALTAAITALDRDLTDHVAASDTLAPLLAGVPALTDRLDELPDELTVRLGSVDAALVGGAGIRGAFTTLADAVERDATGEAVTDVLTQVSGLVAWLEDVLAAIDLSAVTGPVDEVGDRVTAALAELDGALLGVAVEVRGRLEEAASLLDEVDLTALRQRVVDTIDALAADLAGQLGDLAAPTRAAVGAVVDQLADAVDELDPAVVVDALTDVIDRLAAALSDPEVLAAVATIRSAIETAVDELGSASVAPVTDAVIAAIDEVAELLRELDTSSLPGPAKLALQGALAALPPSTRPLTDPLVAELDALLAAGPVPLLERVRQGPASVTARIRAFDPVALVGATLSAPFDELVGRAGAVSPSSSLGPVVGAIEEVRGRLATELDPSVALASLAAPHAAVVAALDALDPGRLVAPVEAALRAATGTVRAAIEDAALAPVAVVVEAVTDAIEATRSVRSSLGRVRQVLADLAALPDDLVAWVDAVFAKLATASDDGSLAAATAAVTTAVDGVQAGPLLDLLDDGLGPLLTRLDALAPRARLTALSAAHRAITPAAVASVTDDTTRAGLVEVLDRCDPLTVAFARPLHVLAGLHDAVRAATADLPTVLSGWDATHHAPDGLLASYRDLPSDPGALGERARDVFDERFLTPALAVLRIAGPVGEVLGGVADELGALLTAADDRLADLAAGPAAFEAIRDRLLDLVDRVAGADLAVVTDALTEVVDTLRTQLLALDPIAFAAELTGTVDVALDAVTVDLVLPPEDVAALDASYQQVVDALLAVDPGRLVTDVVRPAYEAAVDPLVAAFDLTPAIDALTARLGALPDELRDELDRVDTAYQALLRAAPALDLTDLGLDLDLSIEVAVPSPF
jgi:hypothetical protein